MKKDPSILLIDDDKINNYLNVRLFKKLNTSSHISIVRNGADALTYIKKSGLPDFIFLDIEMPIMNGVKFLEEYFKVYTGDQEVKIIILATTIHPVYLKILTTYPIHSYLSKPLTIEKTHEVMTNVLLSSQNINPAPLHIKT